MNKPGPKRSGRPPGPPFTASMVRFTHRYCETFRKSTGFETRVCSSPGLNGEPVTVRVCPQG